MKRLFALSCAWLAIVMPLAGAQGVAQTATVTIKPPTTNTDGSAITGAITYNIYQGPKAGPFTKTVAGTATTVNTIASLTAGTCFEASAIVGGTESGPSAITCLLQPNSPGITVTLNVTIS